MTNESLYYEPKSISQWDVLEEQNFLSPTDAFLILPHCILQRLMTFLVFLKLCNNDDITKT